MSFGSGGGAVQTPTTTTTSTEPWSAAAREGLATGYQQAQQLAPQQYYPGQTTVPFSNQTEQALSGIESTALNQSGGVLPTAIDQARNVMSGGMLNANPYLDSMFNQAANAVQGRLGSTFGGSTGAFGSGMHQAAMGSALGDLATNIYGQNYARERAAQDAMLAQAPTFEQMRYDPYQRLQGVGAAREAQAGTELQSDIARWNFQQNQPFEDLARRMALLSGGQFGTQTTTGQVFSNPLATYGGLGVGLLSALGNLGYQPFGP